MNAEKYWRELVAGERRRVGDRILLALLRGAARLYALGMRGRALGYRIGILPSHRLPVPVISVGNLTMGGTGKTPMVAWLADFLIKRGKRVAVLSRGYGGSAHGAVRVVADGSSIRVSADEAGDEPYLLARKVPGLIVGIGADRKRAADAIAEFAPDVIILDDGFQHLRIKRDLNILLLDARRPFAEGVTIPAGFLRESPAAAARADLVVYTRAAAGEPPEGMVAAPFCRCSHALGALTPLAGGAPAELASLEKGARVMAFSGIADPAAFFDALEAAGVRLITTLAFPDHTPYGEEEVAAILRLRDASRSTVLLTTEKDAVKLLPVADKLGRCYSVALQLDFADPAPLLACLERLVTK